MAKSFVDYTKPAMRDETWRRWKGGEKLAEQLRMFYTNPRVFARLAAINPGGPALPPVAADLPAKAGEHRMDMRKLRAGAYSDRIAGGRRSARVHLARQMLSRKSAEEENAARNARQSGATL